MEKSKPDINTLFAKLSEIEEISQNHEDTYKLKTMYPDHGDFPRQAYHKHLAFFKAPTKERLFIAGNRCLTPWTLITTASQTEVSVFQVFSGLSPEILSWDGEKQCTGLLSDRFLVGYQKAYRVLMEDGQFFECSAGHELLTDHRGFLPLAEILSTASLLKMSCTAADFLRCYDKSIRPHAPHTLSYEAICQGLPPLPSDPLGHAPLHWHRDDAGHTPKSAPHTDYQNSDHLSNSDAVQEVSAWLSRFGWKAALNDRLLSQALHQASVLYPHSVDFGGGGLANSRGRFLASLRMRDSHGLLLESTEAEHTTEIADFESLAWKAHACEADQLFQKASCEQSLSVFLPFNPPSLFGGKKIVAIVPIGVCPIIDLSIQNHNTYFCAGVIHHNCGKTVSGAYEMTLHLTGLYPDWWDGKRFNHPINAWAAGKTNESTRGIIQLELLGKVSGRDEDNTKAVSGTGMIPKHLIGVMTWKSGITNFVDTVQIKHVSGGWSELGFKTYAQGRDVFEGTKLHVIWFDEEPPLPVYSEALIRTMTTRGIIYVTFTPLEGLSETVLRFLPEGHLIEGVNIDQGYSVISMTWDDAPHLDEDEKRIILGAIQSPMERDARSKGIPAMGAGRIYPVPEDKIMVDPFPIPPFWSQGYALDVGLVRTAVLWGAWDKENDVVYITAEYYEADELPIIHSKAIMNRGKWMYGVVDPAARGRNAATGERLIDIYRECGLTLIEADNSVDAGIALVWDRLRTGRLKIFNNLPHFAKEYRLYRRDDKFKVIKVNDHLMDCLRYLIISGLDIFMIDSAKAEDAIFSHLKGLHKNKTHAENDYDPI